MSVSTRQFVTVIPFVLNVPYVTTTRQHECFPGIVDLSGQNFHENGNDLTLILQLHYKQLIVL